MCKICASKCKGCTETVLHNWLNMHEIIGASYKSAFGRFVLAPVSVSITSPSPGWVQPAKPPTWYPAGTNCRDPGQASPQRAACDPKILKIQVPLLYSGMLNSGFASPILWVAKVWFREVQQERDWREALPTNFCCNGVEFLPAGSLQMQIGRPKILHSRLSRILKAGSMSACNSTSRCSTSLTAAEKIIKKLQTIHSSQQLSWSYS